MRLPADAPPSTGVARVRLAVRRPGPFPKYVDQIVGGSGSSVEFEFAHGAVQRFDADVIHAIDQNVEHLVGHHKASAAKKVIATLAFVLDMRRHRITLVQTVIDSAGQAKPNIPRRLLNSVTSHWVTLNPNTRTPSPSRTVVIPHAHYKDRFVGYPGAEPVRGRVLVCMIGNLPKSAPRFAGFVRAMLTPDATMRFAGHASSEVRTATDRIIRRSRGRVSARFEKLSDGAIVQELDAAEILFLPQVQTFEDHQIVLMALSRNRPVLVPESEEMQLLAAQVGDGWVFTYSGFATPAVIDDALASLRQSGPRKTPDLDRRAPAAIAATYADLYMNSRKAARVGGRSQPR